MTWTITKDFPFEASHRLTGLPDDHQCGRHHGHSYRARVTLTGTTLDQHGFVLDYGDLAPFRHWVDTHLDHRHLNDALPVQPSAENIARHLHGILLDLVPLPPGVTAAMGISETPKTWATYHPDPA